MPPLMQGQSSQLGSTSISGSSSGATALTGIGTFTDICDIYANQGESDSMGGFLDNWVTTATNVPCSIKAHAPLTERVQGEQIVATGVYDISLPTDTDIDPDDRIVCNAVTYEVRQRDSVISNQIAITVRALRLN